MSRKTLLVANPTAQSGRAKRTIERAAAQLRRQDMRVQVLHTLPAGKTVELVTAHLNAHPAVELVVCLGGDGTFHEIAKGMMGAVRRRPLGMLPAGTANDQGASFGIERGDIKRNVAIIAEGFVTQLDVGHIEKLDKNGEVIDASLFFDSCGFGLNPEILAARNRQRQWVANIPVVRSLYRDQAIYFTESLRQLLRSYFAPVKFACEVLIDDIPHRYERLTDVMISGTAIYAGHWVVDRRSEPDDGIFEFAYMRGRRDWASKTLRDLKTTPIWQEDLDKIGWRPSVSTGGTRFEIQLFRDGRPPLRCQVDGESWGFGDRFRVTICDERLPLITPRDFVPPWKPGI